MWYTLATLEPKQGITTQAALGGSTCRLGTDCTLSSIDYVGMTPTARVDPLPNHGCRERNYCLFVKANFVSGCRKDNQHSNEWHGPAEWRLKTWTCGWQREERGCLGILFRYTGGYEQSHLHAQTLKPQLEDLVTYANMLIDSETDPQLLSS